MGDEEKNEEQMEVETSGNPPPSNKNTPERPKRTTKPFSAAKLLGLAVKPKDGTKIKSPQKGKIKNADEKLNKSIDAQKSKKDEKEDIIVLNRDQMSPSSAPAGPLLKPFELGWRREIVYRGVQNPVKTTKQCDVYYFTPDNIKLRSLPMIMDYLGRSGSELSRECFSFSKQRIFKEPQEIVRDAGKSRNSMNNSIASAFETSISEIDAKTPKTVKIEKKAKMSEKKEPKHEEQLQKSEKKRGRKSLASINNENLQDDVKKIFTEMPETVKTPETETVKKRGRKKRKFSEVKSDDDDSSKTIQKKLKTDEDFASSDSINFKMDEPKKTDTELDKTDKDFDTIVQSGSKTEDSVQMRLETEKDSSKTVKKKPKTGESGSKIIKEKISSVENSKLKIKKNSTLKSKTECDAINAMDNNKIMTADSPEKDIIKKKLNKEDVLLNTEDEKELIKKEEKSVDDEENNGLVKHSNKHKKFEKNDFSKGKELSSLVGNNVEQVNGKNDIESSFQEDKSLTKQLNKVTDGSVDNFKVKNSELKNKTNGLAKSQSKITDAKENKKKYGSETCARPVVSSLMCDFCMNYLPNKYLNNFNSGSKEIMCEACKAHAKEIQHLEYPTFVGKNEKISDDDLQIGDNQLESNASSKQSVGEEAEVENQVLSIDPQITSILDISKKFFLCVNDTKIPVEPSNVHVNDSLNIGLGQCPLPKELIKGSMCPLQFSVESSGEVQLLNVTISKEL